MNEISSMMSMNAKAASVLVVLLLSSCLLYGQISSIHLRASDGLPVHNLDSRMNYTSIQAALDAPETLSGHRIFVDPGTYLENIVVNKPVSLEGANPNSTIIDGGNGGSVVNIITSDIRIAGFTVKRGATGILAEHSNNSIIEGNIVFENTDAIVTRYSYNCTVAGNIVGDNSGRGILITNSGNFTATGNKVFRNNMYGLNANASISGLFRLNVAFDNNYDGIGLLSSSNCAIIGNTVFGNPQFGVLLSDSLNNRVYLNNIIDNGVQASALASNSWNNSVEGNYWSDYPGLDYDEDHDGIGDWAHVTGSGEVIDNYPLLGRYYEFEAGKGRQVGIVSNSTVESSSFVASGANGTIVLSVSNATAEQVVGFCRVRIPHSLLTTPFSITVSGSNPEYWNYDLYDDGSSRWVFFTYNHSMREILIKGVATEAPPTIKIISPRNMSHSASNIPLTFTVDEQTSWMGYELDGRTNVTVGGNTTLISLAEGAHILTLYANDTAGTMGSATVAFIIDLLPPYIVILSPNYGSSLATVSLDFTISEPASWIRYTLDEQANITIQGNLTLSDLTEGQHSIRVYAGDPAGNVGSSERVQFSVDLTAPVVVVLLPENTTYNTATVPLSFTVNEPWKLVGFMLDDRPFYTTSGNATLSSLPDGFHSVIVQAVDEAGNLGTSEPVNFTVATQQGTPILSPPLIGVIVAVVAIVLIVVAYWVVFRKRAVKVTRK